MSEPGQPRGAAPVGAGGETPVEAAIGASRPAAPMAVDPERVMGRSERVTFALRQIGVVAVSLVAGGAVVATLRPDSVADRGFAQTPFWWAAAIWALVLLFNAVAFERSRLRSLEREPLWLAVIIAGATIVLGIANLTRDSVGEQLLWLAGQALGWFVFWWALASLAHLLSAAVAD